jgi:ribosomal protein S18 acetylase RimI-like enzyme
MEEIKIQLAKPEDWPAISSRIIDLDRIIFPEIGLKENKENLKEMFSDWRSISSLALRNGEIVGYSNAGPLENYEELHSVAKDPEFGKSSAIYLTSIIVHPDNRSKGIGNKLIDSLINEMQERDYNTLTGHFLPDSQRLMISRGAETIKEFKNWYNLGLPAKYMRLNIK